MPASAPAADPFKSLGAAAPPPTQAAPTEQLRLTRDLRTRLALIGMATAGDVAFSNMAFIFVTVTFYTITKSSSLLWMLIWAVGFGLESPPKTRILAVIVICLGLGPATYGETKFSLPGLVCVLCACVLSGLRWGLMQQI